MADIWCVGSLWGAEQLYQILLYSDGISWDIRQWKLLIKSHFLPAWHLALSLVMPKSEYLWAQKSWWVENLYSDRFWHEESENYT